MTVEEIDLLYADLCSRIPCGVAYHWKGRTSEDDMPHYLNGMNEWMIFYIQQGFVKPYLRPLSSMTEEEWKEFEEIFGFPIGAGYNTVTKKLNVYNYVVIDKGYGVDIWFDDIANILNWLNAHHFDYRGLIEKGLAIAVTEENDPYKD